MPEPSSEACWALALSESGQAVLRLQARRLSPYLGPGLDEDDLLQAGRIGLLEAARRYDPRRGRFATYARWWVLEEMGQVIQQSQAAIRIPRDVRDLLGKAARLRARGAALSVDLLAEELGVTPRMARVVRDRLDEGLTLPDPALESLPDEAAFTEDAVVEQLTHQELAPVVGAALQALPAREQEILRGLYGLEGSPRCNLPQLGERLGMSKQRVQQIQQRALARIRSHLSR